MRRNAGPCMATYWTAREISVGGQDNLVLGLAQVPKRILPELTSLKSSDCSLEKAGSCVILAILGCGVAHWWVDAMVAYSMNAALLNSHYWMLTH